MNETKPLNFKWQLIALKEGEPAADAYFAELRIQQARREAEAAAKFEAELWQTEAAPNTGAVKSDDQKEFNLRLAALRQWMINKGLEPDSAAPIVIKPTFRTPSPVKII